MSAKLKTLMQGLAIGAAVLTALLFIQHSRHGWPFSLHHGVTPTAVVTATVPARERVALTLNAHQREQIGIRLEAVKRAPVHQALRGVATVVPDEARIFHVHARVAGWLEALHVNTTGQSVRSGDALADVFSQELLATQNEYLAARRSSGADPASMVVAAAKSRLQTLGMTAAEISEIERRGEARRLVTLTAPGSGVVLRRNVSAGTAVDPSTELMTIADLSQIWVLVDIAESAAAQVAVGTSATLHFAALGATPLRAQVSFVYPTLSERSRTLRLRFVLPNRDGVLRPGLFGEANFDTHARDALVVPRDAVVDTGRKQYVYVANGDELQPREVQLGVRLDEQIEVQSGLAEGDMVVASGVFLLDSESRLQASGNMGGEHGAHGKKAAPQKPEHQHDNADAQP